jgi:hypothetical protein
MPRTTKIIILITLVVILVAAGTYVGVQCSVKNPLTVRILKCERLTEDRVSVTYEVENTSSVPVMGIAYLGLHQPDPAGFDGYSYMIGDRWDAKKLRRGEKQVFDLPMLDEAGMKDSWYFLYVWDPVPNHLMRKISPRFRGQMPSNPLPLRVGFDGPFTLEISEKP